MIDIRIKPEIHIYQPLPATVSWTRVRDDYGERYQLEPAHNLLKTDTSQPPRGIEGPVWTKHTVLSCITLLESGAILASFPLNGHLPGQIRPDTFSVWFHLDAPLHIQAGVFGKFIRIESGRHLMAQSLDSWMVYFKPDAS